MMTTPTSLPGPAAVEARVRALVAAVDAQPEPELWRIWAVTRLAADLDLVAVVMDPEEPAEALRLLGEAARDVRLGKAA